MSHQFINPNWHIILIHYPIGLLMIGLLVEVLSFFKPQSGFRSAGRWMIGIGALVAVPTLFSGLYAFRGVVSPEPIMTEQTWQEVKAHSEWNSMQWLFMQRHIWLNAVATGLGIVIVVLWLAYGSRKNKVLYWSLLLALVATNALVGLGAWHGGETIYRYGTAVKHEEESQAKVEHDLDYWAPPLQVHVIMAGLAVASALVGIGLMLRRWERVETEPAQEQRQRPSDPLALDPSSGRLDPVTASMLHQGDVSFLVAEPPRVYPGWFYLGASVLALVTAFFGLWSVMDGAFSRAILRENYKLLREPDHFRLLIHTILGIAIVITPLVLGLWVRLSRRQRIVPLVLTVAAVAAIGLQIWFGVLILFDGHEGPNFSFNTPAHPAMTQTTATSTTKPATRP